MFLLGVLCLIATALAQPTVYITKSSIAYPSYRMYLSESVPKIALIKEKETVEEPEMKLVPEAPVLDPLPVVKSVDLEAEEPLEETDEKKEEELERNAEEEQREEVLTAEGPKKEESEEDKKVVVKLEVPKPPKVITNFISNLPIKFPSFQLPFNLGSLWKPKEKEIRLVPAYNFGEWTTLI